MWLASFFLTQVVTISDTQRKQNRQHSLSTLRTTIRTEMPTTSHQGRSAQGQASTLSARSPPVPANGKSLTASVTGFINKLRPSKKPERGGTIRTRRPYSANDRQSKSNTSLPLRTASGSRRPGMGPLDRHDSDTIPARSWNIPRRAFSIRSSTARKPVLPGLSKSVINKNATRPRNLTPIGTNGRKIPPRTKGDEAYKPSLRPVAEHPTHTQELFMVKQELRQQRRILKKSGDFLGVTGANPHTGVMDTITPTTSSEDATLPYSSPTNSRLAALDHAAKDARLAYKDAEIEARQRNKLRKVEKRKEAARAVLQQHGGNFRWQKEEARWSSVAEPKLDTIPQSQTNSPGPTDSDTGTIQRSPTNSSQNRSPFLGMAAAAMMLHRPAIRGGDITNATENQRPGQQRVNDELPPPRSSSLRRRTLHFTLPPMISRRRVPGKLDTSQSADDQLEQQVADIRRQTRRHSLPASMIPLRITSGKALRLENQNPSDQWASMLIEDLGSLEHSSEMDDLENRLWMDSLVGSRNSWDQGRPSAFTHTTTTIGSEHRRRPLLVDGQVCGEIVNESRRGEQTPSVRSMAISSPTSSPSLTETINNDCLSPSGSLLDMQLSNWPSTEDPIQVSTAQTTTVQKVEVMAPSSPGAWPSEKLEPETATTSSQPTPQTVPTKNVETTPQQVSTESHTQKELRKTMRKNHGNEKEKKTVDAPSSTLTLTTGQSSPAQQADQGLDQAIARGAARVAFTHLSAESQGQPQAQPKQEPKRSVSRQRTEPGPVSASASSTSATKSDRQDSPGAKKAKAGAEPEGDRQGHKVTGGLVRLMTLVSNGAKRRHHKKGGDAAKPSKAESEGPPDFAEGCKLVVVWVLTLLNISLTILKAYWRLVWPVFDGESDVRKRLSQGQTTFADGVLFFLGAMFWFGALLAGCFLVRGIVCVAVFLKMVVRGMGFVMGFY
ncbi:hypothetical protein QBC35DRAFT_485245 [Podospora australis]|uniref:Uncharacterized protein n=1 Tax=Podospora australis TaxID=1536484 RepID=A0AAN7AKE9_9PEZI|nr:hypothetical protein QBC35DRAFT_485245 [Podospora australis]